MSLAPVTALPEVPVVSIFVRHGKDADGKPCPHSENETWKKCRCPKHLRWSYGGRQYRQAAKTRSWAQAEEAKRRIEDSYRPQPLLPEEVRRKTIEEAVELFLTHKRNEKRSRAVIDRYTLELGRMRSWFEAKGKYFITEIGDEAAIAYQAEWHRWAPAGITQAMMVRRMRGFFKFCLRREWIRRVPEFSTVSADYEPTMPFTPAQMEDILKAIERMPWTADKKKRYRSLVLLMRYSGLAILDACSITRAQLFKDDRGLYRVTAKRTKTKTDVSVVLPGPVAEEIMATPGRNSRYIFWQTGTGTAKSLTTQFHKYLKPLFEEAGIPDGRPHRFRDTFAVELLKKGVPLEDVSKLLGHKSITTTEKYYAPWVVARLDRLDSLVVATFEPEPEPEPEPELAGVQ